MPDERRTFTGDGHYMSEEPIALPDPPPGGAYTVDQAFTAKQVGATNVATGNARVGLQIGQVIGGSGGAGDRAERAAARSQRRAAPAAARAEDITVTNVRTGNARVGVQTDVVTGDLTIRPGSPPATAGTTRQRSATPMTTAATISSGEVTDLDSARTVATEIEAEALSDLDDATADAEIAKEQQARDEQFAASLATQKYGPTVVGLAGQLADLSGVIKEAAAQRLFSADKRKALAQNITTALGTAEGARA